MSLKIKLFGEFGAWRGEEPHDSARVYRALTRELDSGNPRVMAMMG